MLHQEVFTCVRQLRTCCWRVLIFWLWSMEHQSNADINYFSDNLSREKILKIIISTSKNLLAEWISISKNLLFQLKNFQHFQGSKLSTTYMYVITSPSLLPLYWIIRVFVCGEYWYNRASWTRWSTCLCPWYAEHTNFFSILQK